MGYLEAEAARSKRSSTDVDLDTACEPAEYKRVARAVSWPISQPTSELPAALPSSQVFVGTCCSHVTPVPYHGALTTELARAKQELHSNDGDPCYDLAYDLANLV